MEVQCNSFEFTRHAVFKMFERGITIPDIKEAVQNKAKMIMQCTICKNGDMKGGKATVTLQRGESVIVIKSVPASVCENCGEYTLDEQTAARVMEIAEKAVENNAEIEVLQYAA